MTMQKYILFALIVSAFQTSQAQVTIQPPTWFSFAQADTVELLLQGKKLQGTRWTATGLTILGVEEAPNPDYQYLTVVVPAQQPAFTATLNGVNKRKKTAVKLDIHPARSQFQPKLNAADLIYLITPDRFANGNPNNDRVKGMLQQEVNRANPDARHGGDLAGIDQHLNYIADLGPTAVWINPVLENNQADWSYHGYAITNHYRIDPRMGTLEEYQNLVNNAHAKGIKVIMDVVYNHLGDQHAQFKSPPSSDWFNGPGFADGGEKRFVRTNYRTATLMDPYSTPGQLQGYNDGWFDHHMPDLNQRNPHVARWLLNNTIWWIETAGIDALRIDTYAYPDQTFMNQLTRTLHRRYPEVFLFGEVWDHTTAIQSYFDNRNPARPAPHGLDGLTDFQLHYATMGALTEPPAWAKGIERVYLTLAADYQYSQPYNLVTFLDNHDEGRYFGKLEQNLEQFKLGVVMLMTLRGIPSLYYGTEILLKETNGHGMIRQDFPGGWPGDARNAFEPTGRTGPETDAYTFVRKWAQFRKNHPDLMTGAFKHFYPTDGLYVYFRKSGKKTLMVAINTGEKPVRLQPLVYDEVLGGVRDFESLPSGQPANLDLGIEVAPGGFFAGYAF
jgi:glycosidase